MGRKKGMAADADGISSRTPFSSVVVHYAEIGLKGRNRSLFENQLVRNIKAVVDGRAKRIQGRVLVEPRDMKAALGALARVFGVANFSPAVICKSGLPAIRKAALGLMGGRKGTFRVDTRRAYKQFPKTSVQLNEILGRAIGKAYGLKVRLNKPKNTLHVEVLEDITLLYFDVHPGPGGLPVGSSGRVASLLSGGIDSPVAAWMAMKRGCDVTLVHFYNDTMGGFEKIKRLASILSKWQPRLTLLAVPFREAQNRVVAKVPGPYRMLVYRRLMFRIAEALARKENAKALVTGESLGQVASQTLENLSVIESVSSLPVFRPLIGLDKKEIIRLAEQMGTYALSVLPYQDCCSFMVAKHPVTRARLADLEKIEKEFDMDAMVNKAVGGTKRVNI